MDSPRYIVVLDDGETYGSTQGAKVIVTNAATLATAEEYHSGAEALFLRRNAQEVISIGTLIAVYLAARDLTEKYLETLDN